MILEDIRTMPKLFCLGLNYRTSPVSVRERYSVAKSKLAEANLTLYSLTSIEECVLLSTCNRMEVYAWTHNLEMAKQELMAHFSKGCEDLKGNYFYHYEQHDALRHLGFVAAGLDSMVIGETEIFGQIKDAYKEAFHAGCTSTCANRTFQHIFRIGKRIRSNSSITSGPTSVGAAAVQMAQDIMGSLSGKSVLIVGAGDVARSTAQSLKSRGAKGIFVANRSYHRAVDLAEQVQGKVIRFSEWIPYLEKIDIILVSTASPVYVINYDAICKVQERRSYRDVFFMDLSVPRNIDPACAEIKGVHLFDIDALVERTESTRFHRNAQIAHCEGMLNDWLLAYQSELLECRRYHSATLTEQGTIESAERITD